MKNIVLLISIILLNACQNKSAEHQEAQNEESKEITFTTSDGIKIYGDLFELDKAASIILLFHQGGSNARAEYSSIIPRLTEQGFNVLAIDQRMGGQYFGGYNRTLTHIKDHNFSNSYGYCDAYNNLEGALKFVIDNGFTGDKIAWGSSYSATLAIQLASKNTDKIKGVLAFSPASGNPMKGCEPDPYFETLKTPLLLLRPPNEMQSENVQAQFYLAKKLGHQVYSPENGVHGSSMLVKERVGHDVEPTWKIVNSFLERIGN